MQHSFFLAFAALGLVAACSNQADLGDVTNTGGSSALTGTTCGTA